MEEYLRRALLISRGDPLVFVTRPISAGFLLATFIILVLTLRRRTRTPATSDAPDLQEAV